MTKHGIKNFKHLINKQKGIKMKKDNKVVDLIATMVSTFADQSAELDPDVDDNMKLLAVTVLSILKRGNTEQYNNAMYLLDERTNETKH